MTRETCPDAERHHTPVPAGYVERSEDADQRLALGQTQHVCPTCGLWAVWHASVGSAKIALQSRS